MTSARRSPFGPAFEDLTLEELKAALPPGEYEPLTWEAKGTKATREAIRRHVCGFANSRGGGILILGASQAQHDGPWAWAGVPMVEEPIAWIDQVIRDGLDPVPSFVPRPFGLGSLGPIIGIRVAPISVPPCVTRDGQVFERVTGRTIPVASSADLARLFDRGAAVESRIIDESHRAAGELHDMDSGWPQSVTLSIAAASLPGDISHLIFREAFSDGFARRVGEVHGSIVAASFRAMLETRPRVSQGGLTITSASRIDDERFMIRARRHGGLSIGYYRTGVYGATWAAYSRDVLGRMFDVIQATLEDLGAQGRTHLVGKFTVETGGSLEADQWSDTASDGTDELAKIVRDVRRGLGEWDPEP